MLKRIFVVAVVAVAFGCGGDNSVSSKTPNCDQYTLTECGSVPSCEVIDNDCVAKQ